MIRDLFADGDSAKVLDFLLDYPEGLFSKADIMRDTHVSFRKLKKVILPFEQLGIIVLSKKIARANLYKLNNENEIFRILVKLDMKISEPAKSRSEKSMNIAEREPRPFAEVSASKARS